MSLFLFPGQGSQVPGMGADFYAADESFRAFVDAAASMMPAPDVFLKTMFEGPADALEDTRMAQPALLTIECAIADYLMRNGMTPGVVAGHSLGEIPALVTAGVFSFETALEVTQRRAHLMADNVPDGGMAAVLGAGAEALEEHLPEGVEIANYNGPQQTIISGTREGIAEAGEGLKPAGARRVVPLKVSGPFHSSLMREAAAMLSEMLVSVEFSAPRLRYVSSVSGQQETDPAVIKDLMGRQLYSPVRWTDVMARAAELGCAEAVEVGPGGVLRGLARRIDGAPRVTVAGTFEEASAVLASV